MKRTFLFYCLVIFKLGIFQAVQFDLRMENLMAADELPICNNIGLESQLQALKSNISDILKPYFSLLHIQLKDQEKQWRNLDEKINNINNNLQTMEKKILNDGKDKSAEIKRLMNQQYQTILPKFPAPVGDEKCKHLTDIKDMLKSHDKSLGNFEGKLNKIEIATNTNNHMFDREDLVDGISKTFQLLQNIDKHVNTIEENIETNEIALLAIMEKFQKLSSQMETMKAYFQGAKQNLETSLDYPQSCADEACSNNSCRISNRLYGPDPFLVSCDHTINDGGWTVIQRRIDGSVDFYRNWAEYKKGFGDIDGEFFIGLDKLHALTTMLKPVELMIQLKDFNNTMVFAKYSEFEVAREEELYKLNKVGAYSGTAGDCFGKHQGFYFSTKDHNNDLKGTTSCPETRKGAWWYDGCGWSNLNGMYSKTPFVEKHIYWCGQHGFNYSYKFVQMAIKPRR